MGLSKKAIEEFKKIYFKEKGERISNEKAKELGENLISLFKIIYRPYPQEKEEQGKKNDPLTKPPQDTTAYFGACGHSFR